jgi:predicted ester cyclase
MSVSENKALYRRYLEILTAHRTDWLDEVVTYDFVGHDLPDNLPPGREGLKQFRRMVDTAFPDFEAALQDIVAEDDRVAARVRIQGHHRGLFAGIAPTGWLVTIEMFEIVRVEHGKIAERWVMRDRLGEMLQMGVVSNSIR